MTEISVIGATFYGNRGAEAMLTTTISLLKKKQDDLNFNVFSYYQTDDQSLINDEQVHIYSSSPIYLVACLIPCSIIYWLLKKVHLSPVQSLLPKSLRALAKSKALICLAGVSYIDGRNKFLPFNMATILPAIILGVPVVKFSQALGPFNTTTNRLAAKYFLPKCNMIYTRGETTHTHMLKLFPKNGNIQRANDIAFLFRPEHSLTEPFNGIDDQLNQLTRARNLNKIVIGICPSNVLSITTKNTSWDYEQSLRFLIEELVSNGYVVAIYPNATRHLHPQKTHNNDLPLLNSIYSELNEETQKETILFHGPINAEGIYHIISNCDGTITSRFHAMVSSLSIGIPVLVIGWSHKYLEVMNLFGQGDLVIDYKDGGTEKIIHNCKELINTLETRSMTIQKNLDDVKFSSQSQVDYVAELIH